MTVEPLAGRALFSPNPTSPPERPEASGEGTEWRYFPLNSQNRHWPQLDSLEMSEDEMHTNSSLRHDRSHDGFSPG